MLNWRTHDYGQGGYTAASGEYLANIQLGYVGGLLRTIISNDKGLVMEYECRSSKEAKQWVENRIVELTEPKEG